MFTKLPFLALNIYIYIYWCKSRLINYLSKLFFKKKNFSFLTYNFMVLNIIYIFFPIY